MEVILFTMKGCSHCDNLKKKLNESNVPFVEKDVEIFNEIYEKFSKSVGSEYLPAVLIGKKAFIPDKSFQTIEQANHIIKNYLLEQSRRGNHLG